MMPPVGMPRPDQAALDGLVAQLETTIDRVALASPTLRRAAMHRLNRAEYGNAIHDLFGRTSPCCCRRTMQRMGLTTSPDQSAREAAFRSATTSRLTVSTTWSWRRGSRSSCGAASPTASWWNPRRNSPARRILSFSSTKRCCGARLVLNGSWEDVVRKLRGGMMPPSVDWYCIGCHNETYVTGAHTPKFGFDNIAGVLHLTLALIERYTLGNSCVPRDDVLPGVTVQAAIAQYLRDVVTDEHGRYRINWLRSYLRCGKKSPPSDSLLAGDDGGD
jgi:hypothetical protein